MGELAVGDLGTFPFPPSLALISALWIMAVGGAVGSFLNVVVYRLPRGLSLVTPPSHCPACKHPIRWYDNVPVLGWFLLRGRCRDCRASIPFRYPLVEAVTAVLFLTVGAADACAAAAWGSLGAMLGLAAYHGTLLVTLLAAALIRYDGHPVPTRLLVPAVLVGLIAPMEWPHLHPMPTLSGGFGTMGGWTEGILGAVAGLVLGHAGRWSVGPRDGRELPLGMAVAGLFLGGRAIVAVGLLVVAIHAAIQALKTWRPALQRTSPGVWLFVLAWAWVLVWPPLVERLQMP